MVWIQTGFAMVGALRRDQGDPRRHHRGRRARRRQRAGSCSATSPSRASGRAHRRAHDDLDRHAQGLRHRPDHDRRQLRHPRDRQRDVQPELPGAQRRRSAPRSPSSCSSLVLPIVIYNVRQMRKQTGDPMSRRSRRPPRSPARPGPPSAKRRCRLERTRQRRTTSRLAAGRRSPRSSSRCSGRSRRSACFVSSFRPGGDIKTTGWWTFFTNPRRSRSRTTRTVLFARHLGDRPLASTSSTRS